MRRDEINNELKNLAFEFFYSFSRFEFTLKENKLLKSIQPGKNAEPGWVAFSSKYKRVFQHTDQTRKLLELKPKGQKVGENLELEWKDVGLNDCDSDLCSVVRMLKTIRNNLFHGGKHGADGWDDPERTKELLMLGKIILDQLAEIAGFDADYMQLY